MAKMITKLIVCIGIMFAGAGCNREDSQESKTGYATTQKAEQVEISMIAIEASSTVSKCEVRINNNSKNTIRVSGFSLAVLVKNSRLKSNDGLDWEFEELRVIGDPPALESDYSITVRPKDVVSLPIYAPRIRRIDGKSSVAPTSFQYSMQGTISLADEFLKSIWNRFVDVNGRASVSVKSE